MGSGDSDQEAPRQRNDGDDRERDRDRGRDRDRRRERGEGREGRGDEDRREKDRRPRGDDRDDRHDRHDRQDRDRRDRDRRRSRSRSPDSRKRQRRDDSEEQERSDRRRREHREPREPRDRRRRSQDGRDEGDDRRRRRRRDDDGGGEERKAIQPMKRDGPLPDQAESFAIAEGGEPPKPPKEKPNWGTTGALAAASNAVAQADGSVVTLKYHEPPEARKPSPRDQWKLFVFKDGSIVDTLDLGARSCWLAGRDEAVVDLLAAHPSISKQHAVLQFRFVEKRNEFGDRIGKVKPYLLDLASANGTTLNGGAVAAQRYVELRDKDLVQFGHSAREYVVMLAPKE